jgi:hypothetical protein
MRVTIAPDTNFFLHAKDPNTLPWAELLGPGVVEILLVVVPQVSKELDNLKNNATGPKTRRARDWCMRISSLILGESEELTLRERSPRIVLRLAPLSVRQFDTSAYVGLDFSNGDDRMVAEVATYGKITGTVPSVLSADAMPIRLAREVLGLAHRWPESWRREADNDAQAREAAELKARLRSLEEREPRVDVLAVPLDGGPAQAPLTRLAGSVDRWTTLDDPFVETALRLALDRQASPPQTWKLDSIASTQNVSATFEQSLNEWRRDLEIRLRGIQHLYNASAPPFAFDLEFFNAGSAGAEKLLIEVRAKGDLRLVDPNRSELLAKEVAKPWPKPPTMLRAIVLGLDILTLPPRPKPAWDLPVFSVPPKGVNVFAWDLDADDGSPMVLRGECEEFRHAMEKERVRVGVDALSTAGAVANGAIEIRISARNLSAVRTVTFPVALTFTSRDTRDLVATQWRSFYNIDFDQESP